MSGVSCASANLCVATDYAGNVVTSTNPTGVALAWTVTNVDGTNVLFGVSCPTTNLCVAVDQAGTAFTATNPTGGAKAWTTTDIDGSRSLAGLSCPSASFCVAIDYQGNAVIGTQPPSGNVPESPLVALLIPVGAFGAIGIRLYTRKTNPRQAQADGQCGRAR
jgi:hypothetical protein